MLNVDLKQSRSEKTFKRSLFKSILDNQMLKKSLNVNYFDIIFNNILVIKFSPLNIAFLVF